MQGHSALELVSSLGLRVSKENDICKLKFTQPEEYIGRIIFLVIVSFRLFGLFFCFQPKANL